MLNKIAKPKNLIQNVAAWVSRNPYIVLFVFVIGILGGLASMIALPFTISPAVPKRQLAYGVALSHTWIVHSGGASDLETYYKGKPFKADLSWAKITIANKGQLPISGDDVSVPIELVLSNAEILHCYFSRAPLAGTQFTLATNLPTSRLAMKWKVLEPGDNPVIQIIYAGNPNTPITLEGRIVGQGNPLPLWQDDIFVVVKRVWRDISFLLLVLLITTALLVFLVLRRFATAVDWCIYCFYFAVLGYGLALILKVAQHTYNLIPH